jgi:glucose/arabinose dehydrogenase
VTVSSAARRIGAAVLFAIAPWSALAQTTARAGRDVAKVYTETCAACHGPALAGGKAHSLLDDVWAFGGDDASMATTIREGRAITGMPPFKALLTAPEIRAMVYFLREQRVRLLASPQPVTTPPTTLDVRSEKQAFRIETVADGLDTPWGITFLPDGRLLVSERPGTLRILELGKPLPPPIADTPAVWTMQDGGLMDVEIHPDFATNGWIYLAYADPGPPPTSTTKIVRGRIRNGHWVDQQVIYQSPAALYVADNTHFGSRFLFDTKGHVFFTIGDRGTMADAQKLTSPNGKIHRLYDDGRVPEDNPFVGTPGALGMIWSYGNRNVQGLAWHPLTGELWATEHGPRGGDELNVIEKGHNYGWPIITYGINYDGTPITGTTAQPGLEQPVTYWTPSIAPSGIMFYTADRFPAWKNDLFVCALLAQQLKRLTLDGHKVVHEEVLFSNLGRVRDVTTGPDGLVYVAINNPGRIVRLVPLPGGTADGH